MLKNHSFDTSSGECDTASSAFMPAVAFEVFNGVDGIAGDYMFPEVKVGVEPYPNAGRAAIFYRYITDTYDGPVCGCFQTIGNKDIKISDPPPDLMRRMQEDWKKLMDLNPELQTVRFDRNNPLSLLYALSGVSSLFNPADIDFFINLQEGSAQKLPEYNALFGEVRTMSTVSIQWIPAPQTLAFIKEKLLVKAPDTLAPYNGVLRPPAPVP